MSLTGSPRPADSNRAFGPKGTDDIASAASTAPGGKPHHDEVDVIVDAWASVRPGLDTTPLEVLSRISRIARRLDQARNAVFTEHELDGWEFDVMSALRRAGEPFELSPGALVQQTLVTSGTMTNRVDGLERRGFVSRQPSPSDRRGVLVRLTPAGLRAVDAAFDALLHHERHLLAGMDDDARAHLAASLRTLLTAVES